jgi:hypothetical protein
MADAERVFGDQRKDFQAQAFQGYSEQSICQAPILIGRASLPLFRMLGGLAAVRHAPAQRLATTESFAWTTGLFERRGRDIVRLWQNFERLERPEDFRSMAVRECRAP